MIGEDEARRRRGGRPSEPLLLVCSSWPVWTRTEMTGALNFRIGQKLSAPVISVF
jgi:hypothetical protein